MNQQKVCSQFVPHFLTDEPKQVCLARTQDLVETADGNPKVLKSILTMYESWCNFHDSQTKWQSAAGLSLGASRPAKVRQQKSKGKTLLITFFDAKGLLHHEFIFPGQTNHFYSLFGSYEMPDAPHSSNPTRVLRTGQLRVCCITMRHHAPQLFGCIIIPKIKSLSYPPPLGFTIHFEF